MRKGAFTKESQETFSVLLAEPPAGFQGFHDGTLDLPDEEVEELQQLLLAGGWPWSKVPEHQAFEIASWLCRSSQRSQSFAEMLAFIRIAKDAQYLGMKDGRMVAYVNSEENVRRCNMERRLPTGVLVGEWYVASETSLRGCLRKLLMEHGESLPVCDIKKLFRERFGAELSETAFGCATLSQLLSSEFVQEEFVLRDDIGTKSASLHFRRRNLSWRGSCRIGQLQAGMKKMTEVLMLTGSPEAKTPEPSAKISSSSPMYVRPSRLDRTNELQPKKLGFSKERTVWKEPLKIPYPKVTKSYESTELNAKDYYTKIRKNYKSGWKETPKPSTPATSPMLDLAGDYADAFRELERVTPDLAVEYAEAFHELQKTTSGQDAEFPALPALQKASRKEAVAHRCPLTDIANTQRIGKGRECEDSRKLREAVSSILDGHYADEFPELPRAKKGTEAQKPNSTVSGRCTRTAGAGAESAPQPLIDSEKAKPGRATEPGLDVLEKDTMEVEVDAGKLPDWCRIARTFIHCPTGPKLPARPSSTPARAPQYDSLDRDQEILDLEIEDV